MIFRTCGLKALETHPFDCVLTDLGMPEMIGWEVARLAKASHPSLPVILLTGWGESPPASPPAEGSVDQILGKPVRIEHLLAAIHAATTSSAG